jgi:3-hydroxyacyl-[acyl-carrier-protein] dehydratase
MAQNDFTSAMSILHGSRIGTQGMGRAIRRVAGSDAMTENTPEMSFEVGRVIRADHPSLAGHFPGTPIVPGVVILDEVAAALAEWRAGCHLMGIRSAKFLLPLRPEQPFTICLTPVDGLETQVDFCCRIDARMIVEGSLEISFGAT